jgi:hypothetical protein
MRTVVRAFHLDVGLPVTGPTSAIGRSRAKNAKVAYLRKEISSERRHGPTNAPAMDPISAFKFTSNGIDHRCGDVRGFAAGVAAADCRGFRMRLTADLTVEGFGLLSRGL